MLPGRQGGSVDQCNPGHGCPGFRPLAKHGVLFFASRILHACKHGGFRACGRDQRAFRSPFGNLRVHTLWNACKFGSLRGRFSCNPVKKCLFQPFEPRARMPGVAFMPIPFPSPPPAAQPWIPARPNGPPAPARASPAAPSAGSWRGFFHCPGKRCR